MFHVYVLQTIAKPWKLYTGFTGRAIDERVRDHNLGKVEATRQHRPWQVMYYESYLDEEDARTRERQIKQYGSTWGHLKSRIKNSLEKGKGEVRSVEPSSTIAKGEK